MGEILEGGGSLLERAWGLWGVEGAVAGAGAGIGVAISGSMRSAGSSTSNGS